MSKKEELEKRRKTQQDLEKVTKREKVKEEVKKIQASGHFGQLKKDMKRLNKDNTVDTKEEMQKKHIDPLL